MKNKIYFFSFFITFIFILLDKKINGEYIKLNFKRKINLTNLVSKELISQLFYSKLFTNISIGTPSQEIEVSINLQKYLFYLISNETTLDRKYNLNLYNNLQSSSFQSEENYQRYYLNSFIKGMKIKDIININGNNTINNKILLIKESENENYIYKSGSIGLKLFNPSYNKYKYCNFIINLENNKLISKIVFSFVFKNKRKKNYNETLMHDEGELLIGLYPDDIDKYHYNDKITTKVVPNNNVIDWKINFDYVQYKDTIIKHCNEAVFYNEIGVIIGTYLFFKDINKTYFKDYIENNLCFIDQVQIKDFDGSLKYNGEDALNDFYEFIYCNNNINITAFENIYFVLKEDGLNLSLSYNDLFYYNQYDNKYYFLIILGHRNQGKWFLGTPFFKKYQISFNQDQKQITFYTEILNEDVEEQNNHFIKIISKKFMILFIISLFVIIGLFYIIFRLYKLIPRRKKANELEDEFTYKTKNNIRKNENVLNLQDSFYTNYKFI